MSLRSRISGMWARKDGQSSVEAAVALPVLMILVLLLLQPGIILYDRIVMQGAASEGCRLFATSDGDASANEAYIRRRLSAVPQIDQFHVHNSGCTWKINCTGNADSAYSEVEISTEVKPLPLLDVGAAMLGLLNPNGNMVVTVRSKMQTHPDWLTS